MKIEFADSTMGELCNNYDPDNTKEELEKYVRKKSGGERTSSEVMKCLSVLRSVKDPSEISTIYNYHLLKYGLKGYATVDVYSRGKGKKGGRGKWRLLFKPISSCDDINNKKSINTIIIIELITDDHKG